MPNFLQRWRNFVTAESLLPAEGRVLVACSGGPDSMVLAALIRMEFTPPALAHCNYGLRPEADAEEALVREYAAQYGLALHAVRFDLERDRQPGESTQMAARRLRYAFFEALCRENGYGCIATAHHQDDQDETLLMSFFRGRQSRLLWGIPLRRDQYVRPLLFARKAEILAFAAAHEVPYSLDSSNFKNNYQRNQVRNQLLPALEALNPSFRDRFREHYREQELQFGLIEEVFLAVSAQIVEDLGGESRVDLPAFARQWPSHFLPLFLSWWLEQQGFRSSDAREARRLLAANTGARFVSEAGELLRDREYLILRREPAAGGSFDAVTVRLAVVDGQWFRVGEREVCISRENWSTTAKIEVEVNVHLLDVRTLAGDLHLRPWQEGDRMRPLGMKGHKKLSDIFVDERYDRFGKQRALVVEDTEGIVLLDGFRIAERVKLRPDTERVVRIAIRAPEETE
ncbi:MAG: tRNA lysidine(34) synthetase TilS [Bacteroidota bacterium]